MPHCIVEAAQTTLKAIEPKRLLELVHTAAKDSELFAAKDIKTRLLPYEFFQVGDGSDGFIHVTLHILSGRTLEQKQGLTDLVLNQLKALPLQNASLTVDVKDTVRETYAKTLV